MQASEILNEIDLTSVGGVAVAAYLLVGVIKRVLPTWTAGKEELIAVGGSILIGSIIKKFGGGFETVAWGTHVVQMLVTGVFAQLIHDKIMDPLLKAVEKTPPPKP